MDVVNMIRINTRMPDALWVDMKAQVASCRVAEKRILELLGKYGVEKTRADHRGHPRATPSGGCARRSRS